MQFFQGVTADRKVITEMRDDDGKVLAHCVFDPEIARTIADNITRCADIAEGIPSTIELSSSSSRAQKA